MSALEKDAADMSAFPLRVLPVRDPRKEKNRQYKQAQRERAKAAGVVKFEVLVSASDAATLTWLKQMQSGNPETFFARALLVGAKFAFNSGNVRGGKNRIKGGKGVRP